MAMVAADDRILGSGIITYLFACNVSVSGIVIIGPIALKMFSNQ